MIENDIVSEHTSQAFGVDHIDFSFVPDQDVNFFTLSLIGCNMDGADTKFLVVKIGRHSDLKNKFKSKIVILTQGWISCRSVGRKQSNIREARLVN